MRRLRRLCRLGTITLIRLERVELPLNDRNSSAASLSRRSTESCALGYEIIPLPPADIAAMQRGYDGLQRMYGAVEGVTTAAARIALAALSSAM